MHLVTVDMNNGDMAGGIAVDGKVFIPSAATRLLPDLADVPKSVKDIISAGETALGSLKRALDKLMTFQGDLTAAGALYEVSAVKLHAPIPWPTLILSCGMNYREHLREMDTPVPATPTAFTKNAASVIGPGESIRLPKAAPNMVDWEGEFTVVIGKAAFSVTEAEALDHVAGYTIVNDVSARDWVAGVFAAKGTMPSILAWEHNILGKQFPTFCPMGPAIVTADEVGDVGNLKLETRLNGQVMQKTSTADLVFNVQQLIAYFSKYYRLLPGDLITTGSPSGVGYGRTPKLFMKPGDTIEVEVERIGILRNPVAPA
jgi:2-keto-4-pentenoate hydratase/2-oxohepta-3-ene-1,7-dioic acid hydratase in catechol pathway